MSSEELAVSVSGVSKSYTIGHMTSRPTTLAEKVASAFRRDRPGGREDVWALEDVSFDVKRGEALGIIGPNGAGKSTLLRVLSAITEPTRGEARVWGRVGSLLEVGTGFHPELTGRENVYLNGCVLGMRKADVDRRFADIVAFSGMERFLDTPAKRYSSGMLVRLAFAVAAHLEPEILIVDEVLAVGDAEFQARCLGKMQEVAAGGQRTVLFVSHNLHAVRALCDRAIVLRGGRLAAEGPVGTCIEAYLASSKGQSRGGQIVLARPGRASIWMTTATIAADGVVTDEVPLGSSLTLCVRFRSEVDVKHPLLGLTITSASGVEVVSADNLYQATAEPLSAPTRAGTVTCDLGQVPLMPGRYTFSLWVADATLKRHVAPGVLPFRVVERDIWGLGHTPQERSSCLWWPTRFAVRAAGLDEATRQDASPAPSMD